MKKNLFIFLAISSFLFAKKAILQHLPEDTVTPWFTGPLIAPSGTVIPGGHFNFEPYFVVTPNPARFNNDWKLADRPDLWTVSFQLPFWVGLTSWADIEISPTLNWNHQQNAGHWALGDLTVLCDLQLHLDTYPHKNWIPSVKLALGMILPSGKYRNLDPNKLGTDSGGGGSFKSVVQLVIARLFKISKIHFLSSRLAFTSTLPTPVHLEGFNSYGGGFGTDGTVYPAKDLTVDLGLEYSLTRNWALALDVIGYWKGNDRFSGSSGVTSQGEIATNTNPAKILYSIAPAIEYNWSANLGIIAGVWFPVAGKNVNQFFSGQIAVNLYQ